MQEDANFLDVFNFKIEDLEAANNQSGPSQFFNPNPKKGIAGVYDAIVRFVPWHKNVKDSLVKKYAFWLKNPLTNEEFGVDCPQTIGQESILQNIFWKFWNSESVIEKDKSKQFKRKDYYYSIVQVVEDKNKPENVGKLMIYKFPFKIWEKIEAEKKPKFGAPNNPYDLFTGKLLGISVKLVSGWNNYDDCKFIEGSAQPICIGGRAMNPQSQEDRGMIMEYLKTAPDLDTCKFQPWTNEQEAKVMEVIKAWTNGGVTGGNNTPQAQQQYQAPSVQQQVYSTPPQQQYQAPQQPQQQYQAPQQPQQQYQQAPQAPQQPQAAQQPIQQVYQQPTQQQAPMTAPLQTEQTQNYQQPQAEGNNEDPLASLYAGL